MKKCPKCKQTKPLSGFDDNHRLSDGKRCYCKLCHVASSREWRIKRIKKEPDLNWRYKIKQFYNLTPDEYYAMLDSQNGVCAICGLPETIVNHYEENKSPQKLSVDHCHKTKKVRGLLCSMCNSGLGKFREDSDLLASATSYLINSCI
jgi:hypothetical protein